MSNLLPGISAEDTVKINPPNFLPEVIDQSIGDLAVTSFANLSSGGKKTHCKTCFALAIHRLAVEINTLLPTFMIIDTPMKNISQRENREQFERIHALIYDLVSNELNGTQIILIDKEFCPPPQKMNISIKTRYMTPTSDENPPLIPYGRGH